MAIRMSAARRVVVHEALLRLRAEAGPRDLETDPLRYVHRFRVPGDQEIVGWLASSLAFGRVASIFQTLDRVLAVLGPHPANHLQSSSEQSLARDLKGIRHRWIGGGDLAWALERLARLQRSTGSLESAFGSPAAPISDRLATFASVVREGRQGHSRASKFLFPDPSAGSACKRLMLFLRWMVRLEPGLDLGLWRSFRVCDLVIPLDTHVAFLGQALRLTSRRAPGWAMALEITQSLRQFEPDDPVSFDWALSRLGIQGRCRHRRVLSLCLSCPLSLPCRVARLPSALHAALS